MSINVKFICAILVAMSLGYSLGRSITKHNMFTEFSCADIGNFHADYLMERYDIRDGFNTDQHNPKRDINRRAAQSNGRLVELCSEEL